MRIRILSIGENRTPYLIEGESVYINRLKHYCRIDMITVPGLKIPDERQAGQIIRKESDRLFKKSKPDHLAIGLDINGRSLSSDEFALQMNDWQNRSVRGVDFLVGGPLGLSGELLGRCSDRISLSKMTFPHDLARLILLEQLYRAFSILRGEKYHK